MKQPRRRGFSLLEVMLATTVLLGSVIVLSHISFVGTAHMDAARQYAAAQLACQARMNEMLAGARPIEEVRAQRIRELPGWGLTVKVRSASRPGLLAIEVTAAERQRQQSTELSTESMSDESADAPVEASGTPQQAVGAGKRFTLVRWIADPENSESPVSDTPVPTDVSAEPSFFGDSVMPVEPPLPEEPAMPGQPPLPQEPMAPDEFLMPQEPPLPAEPSMFDEPLPEI